MLIKLQNINHTKQVLAVISTLVSTTNLALESAKISLSPEQMYALLKEVIRKQEKKAIKKKVLMIK